MPINAVDWQPEDHLSLTDFLAMRDDEVNVANDIHPQYLKRSPMFRRAERYLHEGTPGDAYARIIFLPADPVSFEFIDASPSSSPAWAEAGAFWIMRGIIKKIKISCRIYAAHSGTINDDDIFFRIRLYKRTWADPSTDTLLSTSSELYGPGPQDLEIISGDLSALDQKDFILISFQSKTDNMIAGDKSWARFANIIYNCEES